MITLIFYVIFIYILLVWIITRIIVPHLGFMKSAIPEKVPTEFEIIIQDINTQAKDNLDFLKKSYEYVTNQYHGSRTLTVLHFWYAFQNPILHKPGFLPCTGQNFLLRVMLVKSGRFNYKEIEVKTIPLNLFIHQYLKVKVGNDWIDVDPWSYFLRKNLGQKSAFVG